MDFILRPWLESDAKDLTIHLNNKKIWDNCRDGLPFPYTETDADAFIKYASEQVEQNEYCIEANHEAIGNIGFVRGTDVERFNAEVGFHGVGHAPGQRLAGCPIHNRHKIQKAPAHRKIGDIRTPDMVGPRDRQILQQVRIDRMVGMRIAGSRLLIDRR